MTAGGAKPPSLPKNRLYMKEIKFRELGPDDIEVRPATIKDGKATLLLYIDSRSVVELMDQAVGPFNWNMEFTQVGDQIIGRMGVWDEEKNTWVVKSDTGSESNIEASKGLVSDIYKRCIARWGLTDLYSTPRIVVDDDGYGCKWQVSEISWDEKRNCTHLVLTNRYGKVMFKWDKDAEGECAPATNSGLKPKEAPTRSNLEILKSYCGALKNQDGVDQDDLLRFYRWYENKVNGYDRVLKPEILWNKWLTTRNTKVA